MRIRIRNRGSYKRTKIYQMLSDGEIYKDWDLTPALYNMMVRSFREISANANANAAIESVLCQIGKSLGAYRSFVAVKRSGGVFSTAYEWHRTGIFPIWGIPSRSTDETASYWPETAHRTGIFAVSDARILKDDFYETSEPSGVKAFAHYPIWNGYELEGYMTLHYCRRIHRWNNGELQALRTIAGLIAMALIKMRPLRRLEREGAEGGGIFNAINAAIYITNLESNKILFVNKELNRLYGNEPLDGICWEALHNKDGRCDFCLTPNLPKHPDKDYKCEIEINGKNFRMQSSLIPWFGKSCANLVRMQELVY